MSYTHCKEVRERSPLKATALHIHSLLAQYADKGGVCFPSQERLAKEARCTVRYIKRVIQKLVEARCLEVLQDARDRRRNTYRLLPIPIPILGDRGTGGPEIGELQDRDRGTGGPLPIYRQEGHEIPEVRPETPSPAAKREEEAMIGAIPPDEPEVAATVGLPQRGTQKRVLRYFHNEAVKAGHPDYNVRGLMRVIKQVRETHGYSYDEVEVLMRKFFVGHEHDVRTTRTNLTWRFKDLVPTLVKESGRTVENRREGRVSNRNVVLPTELFAKLREKKNA